MTRAMSAPLGPQLVALLPRARRYALSLCRSSVQADDLVQAACERALDRADSWQPGTRLDAWLFTIMRNLWIDGLRRSKAEYPMDDIDLDKASKAEDGETAAISRLTLDEVRRAIDALPTEQREVLLLVCVDDFAYRDAARILDVPVGTVMSRLARARQKLIAQSAVA